MSYFEGVEYVQFYTIDLYILLCRDLFPLTCCETTKVKTFKGGEYSLIEPGSSKINKFEGYLTTFSD